MAGCSRERSCNADGRRAAGECNRAAWPLAVADGGSALSERDLLVTVARPDGAVSYMVFVAPEPDYQTLKPLFSSMIQSFRCEVESHASLLVKSSFQQEWRVFNRLHGCTIALVVDTLRKSQ